jgi:sugar O-acyltransferase (sialic acid O-acetyltransferase NeuD family)
MIVIGAKGLAGELLEIFSRRESLSQLYFFDNLSPDIPEKLFGRFLILRSVDQAESIFRKTGDPSFCLGLGNPVLRQRLCTQFEQIGGSLTSVISPSSEIGVFGTQVGPGCCILPGAVLTNRVVVGKGCLINPNATISHGSMLGDFVEVSPGVSVTGNCRIGDYCIIGANSVILPKITLGRNVIVGAGAVVTKDAPDNCVLVGVPAVVRKMLPPLDI